MSIYWLEWCVQIGEHLQVFKEYMNIRAFFPPPSVPPLAVGHVLVAINGMRVTGQQLDDGREALQVLQDETNYPINLKFARPRLTTNEKIVQVG